MSLKDRLLRELDRRERYKELATFEVQALANAVFLGVDADAALRVVDTLKKELRRYVFHDVHRMRYQRTLLQERRQRLESELETFRVLNKL